MATSHSFDFITEKQKLYFILTIKTNFHTDVNFD